MPIFGLDNNNNNTRGFRSEYITILTEQTDTLPITYSTDIETRNQLTREYLSSWDLPIGMEFEIANGESFVISNTGSIFMKNGGDNIFGKIRSGKAVVNCKNTKEARDYLTMLHEHHYKWSSGESLIRENINFDNYGRGTCYKIKNDALWFGNINHFLQEHEVIEYADIISWENF